MRSQLQEGMYTSPDGPYEIKRGPPVDKGVSSIAGVKDEFYDVMMSSAAEGREFNELFNFKGSRSISSARKSAVLNLSPRQHDAMYVLAGCADVRFLISNVSRKLRSFMDEVYDISKEAFNTWYKNRGRNPSKLQPSAAARNPHNPAKCSTLLKRRRMEAASTGGAGGGDVDADAGGDDDDVAGQGEEEGLEGAETGNVGAGAGGSAGRASGRDSGEADMCDEVSPEVAAKTRSPRSLSKADHPPKAAVEGVGRHSGAGAGEGAVEGRLQPVKVEVAQANGRSGLHGTADNAVDKPSTVGEAAVHGGEGQGRSPEVAEEASPGKSGAPEPTPMVEKQSPPPPPPPPSAPPLDLEGR
eukprot:gene14364-20364_t